MPKRVFQPKKKKRIRKHGFLVKMATPAGRNVIKRRRAKRRVKLALA